MTTQHALQILFVRHSETNPMDEKGDLGRQLSPKGIALAEATGRDLAARGFRFDLLVTSRTDRSDRTADLIAEDQNGIMEVVRNRLLYLPGEEADYAAFLAKFTEAKTTRGAKAVPEIWAATLEQAQIIQTAVELSQSGTPLVVTHGTLIQLVVNALTGDDSVLDVDLKPCDGLIVTRVGDTFIWDEYQAPKLAA